MLRSLRSCAESQIKVCDRCGSRREIECVEVGEVRGDLCAKCRDRASRVIASIFAPRKKRAEKAVEKS